MLAPIDTSYPDLEYLCRVASDLGLRFVIHKGCVYYNAACGWEQTTLRAEDLRDTNNNV
jgi:hypothetical protein